MAKGYVVYAGPAADAVNYFGGLGYRCPDYTNPSDFFMKLLRMVCLGRIARLGWWGALWQCTARLARAIDGL